MPGLSQPFAAGSYAQQVVANLEELAAQGSRQLRAGNLIRGQPSLSVNLAGARYNNRGSELGSPRVHTSKAADMMVASRIIQDLSPYLAFAKDVSFGTSTAQLLLTFVDSPEGISKRTELFRQQHIIVLAPGQPDELRIPVCPSEGRCYYVDECLVKVQNLDPSLMRVGCISAILEAAGYACCQTLEARNGQVPARSHSPAATAEIIAERAGACPASLTCARSVGYAGRVIGIVRPPADDPYLSNLPKSFEDTCGKVRIVVEYLGSPRSMLAKPDQQRQRAELFQQRKQHQQQARAQVTEARRIARSRRSKARRARKAAAAAAAACAGPPTRATQPAAPPSVKAATSMPKQPHRPKNMPNTSQQQHDQPIHTEVRAPDKQQSLNGQLPSDVEALDAQQPTPAADDSGQQNAVMLYVPPTELGKRSAPSSAEPASPTSSEGGSDGAVVVPTPPQADRPYISSSSGNNTHATTTSGLKSGFFNKRLKT